MDYSCYLWLHRVHPNEEIQGCVFSDIPLRATLISTHLFLVGIVVYSVLSSQNILPPEKYLVALIGSQLEKILWNPLVAIFTFKINDATRQKNAAEERKRKQEIEIQDALKRRKELRQSFQNIQVFVIENSQEPGVIWDFLSGFQSAIQWGHTEIAKLMIENQSEYSINIQQIWWMCTGRCQRKNQAWQWRRGSTLRSTERHLERRHFSCKR